MKKVILMIIGSCLLLTACNTMRGLGQDVSQAGQAISDAAR